METENRQRYRYEKTNFIVTEYAIITTPQRHLDLIYVGRRLIDAPSGRMALSMYLQLHFRLIDARAVSNDHLDGGETVVIFWNDRMIVATNKKAPEV